MKTVNLYYTGTFSAAHWLPGYEGDCSKMHGHAWKVEVWLRGCVDSETGMVLDFRYVKNVIASLDHALLNNRFYLPTAERVAEYFAKELPLAYKVRVWESDHSYAEVDRTYENALRRLTPSERDRLILGEFTNPKVRVKPKSVDQRVIERRFPTDGDRTLSQGFAEGIAEELSDADRPEPLDGTVRR